jgi:predicted AlkP superfamily pyrophosphatase or phosphodiesterase
MRSPARIGLTAALLAPLLVASVFGSAYNARPKLIVVIVIDQFRGDYLERYRDQFGEGGFRLFLDHGAYFTDCNYDYANTHTAPGHATLFTAAYSSGHGIIANEWWDPEKKRMVSSVQDDGTKVVGISSNAPGGSPRNLMASTIGDELKLATQGKAHVYGISLKDRAAILPAGFAADGAYWIDAKTGLWITSTYYRTELPSWVAAFNDAKHADKYLNQEWKDSNGVVLGTTTPKNNKEGSSTGFYETVGPTPLANDYELEFARELVTNEHLGESAATDFLSVSLSANDILGHGVGPDAPEMRAMALAMDRQLADFFNFLGHQVGLANVWIALAADHGVGPLPSVATKLHIPAATVDTAKVRSDANAALNARLSPGRRTEFIKDYSYTLAWLDNSAFATQKIKEDDAEHAVGEALKRFGGIRGYYTRFELAQGNVPNTELGRRYLHSYSPVGGWYVMAVPVPFSIPSGAPADHLAPYTYDTHIPLAFYGLAFQPGTYRQHVEPVDLAVTLASLLGINAPTHAIGRVLTEALAPPHTENTGHPPASRPAKSSNEKVQPVTLSLRPGDAQ